jgi:hypothetical protein
MKLFNFRKKSKEQIHKTFTDRQNKSQVEKFALIPFNKRFIFAPHCMRNTATCAAEEKESYYICAECSGCKINEISRLAKKLNYKALYILKGGRAIEKIIKEQKPKAIVGISCFLEGEQAFRMLKNENVAVQFVPLTKDGCAATDANINEVERILRYAN